MTHLVHGLDLMDDTMLPVTVVCRLIIAPVHICAHFLVLSLHWLIDVPLRVSHQVWTSMTVAIFAHGLALVEDVMLSVCVVCCLLIAPVHICAHISVLSLRWLINLPFHVANQAWIWMVVNPVRGCLQTYNVSIVCYVFLLPILAVRVCCWLVSGPCRWWYALVQNVASAWTSVTNPFNCGLAQLWFGFGALELVCGVVQLQMRQELIILGA